MSDASLPTNEQPNTVIEKQRPWQQVMRDLAATGDKQLVHDALELAILETDRARVKLQEASRVAISPEGKMVVQSLDALREVGKFFAEADEMIPEHFRGKPGKCAIAHLWADRLGLDTIILMQHSFVHKGKMGLDSKVLVGLLIASGKIKGRPEYIIQRDPTGQIVSCQCMVHDVVLDKIVEGPIITAKLVQDEGWNSPRGTQTSKWLTIPEQMYVYRAGAWLVTSRYQDVVLGLESAEELREEAENELLSPPRIDLGVLQAPAAPPPSEIKGLLTGEQVARLRDVKAAERLPEPENKAVATPAKTEDVTPVEAEPKPVRDQAEATRELEESIRRQQAERATRPEAVGASRNAPPEAVKPPADQPRKNGAPKGFAAHMARIEKGCRTREGCDNNLQAIELDPSLTEQELEHLRSALKQKREALR